MEGVRVRDPICAGKRKREPGSIRKTTINLTNGNEPPPTLTYTDQHALSEMRWNPTTRQPKGKWENRGMTCSGVLGYGVFASCSECRRTSQRQGFCLFILIDSFLMHKELQEIVKKPIVYVDKKYIFYHILSAVSHGLVFDFLLFLHVVYR